LLKTEWVKPGTGRTVGELQKWISKDSRCDYRDPRRTSLDIVRAGPPEPYDVERAVEAIRKAGVEFAPVVVSDDTSGEYNRLRVEVGTAVRAARAAADIAVSKAEASAPSPAPKQTEFKVVLHVRTPTQDDGGPSERELTEEVVAALAGRVRVVTVDVQVWEAETTD
jgi:hypothetical protein